MNVKIEPFVKKREVEDLDCANSALSNYIKTSNGMYYNVNTAMMIPKLQTESEPSDPRLIAGMICKMLGELFYVLSVLLFVLYFLYNWPPYLLNHVPRYLLCVEILIGSLFVFLIASLIFREKTFPTFIRIIHEASAAASAFMVYAIVGNRSEFRQSTYDLDEIVTIIICVLIICSYVFLGTSYFTKLRRQLFRKVLHNK